ncbi:MAG: FHA domain-containing protein, partial [Caldimonas sp.]
GEAAVTPLALLEAVDRDGQVRQSWRVERWPLTIGRSLDNDVVLTDPHVAPHHATIAPAQAAANDRIEPAEATGGASDPTPALAITAGDTRNGLGVGRERLVAGQSRTLADATGDIDLHLGRTTLRLRLAGHALAPEQAMAAVVGHETNWWPTLGIGAVVLAFVVANAWIGSDPEGFARALASALLGAVFVGAVWCGLWALLSKTFTRQSHFGWHVRVFVMASLATLVLAVLPALLAFALSWPWIADFAFVAVYATVAAAIYFHLLAVEPGRRRLMRAVAVAGFVAGVAVSLWFNVQRTGRPGEELYMNHLFPPQLRLAKAVPVERFIDSLAPMQAVLDRKAKEQFGTDSDSRTGSDDDD